jgi:adenylate cyclase class 2
MDELEIEIKAYCKDLEKVKEKLVDLGAVYIQNKNERDMYFNHPCKDFGETDEALRIRTVDNLHILTYKGPKLSKNSKARVEQETVIEDIRSMEIILQNLGFVESGQVEKSRDYYSFEGIDICLDRIKSLGDFVELELKGDNIEVVEKKLYNLAEKLTLIKFERKSYLELLYFS